MTGALEQFLIQREAQKRQAMLDELAQKREARADQLAMENLSLQQQQARAADAHRQAQLEDLANEREFRRANTIAENAIPDDPTDAATKALLEKHGFGNMVRTLPGVVSQGPLITSIEDDPEGIPRYEVNTSPERIALRGGSKYLSARAAEDARRAQAAEANASREEIAAERAAQAEQTRLDRAEQAEANRQNALLIASGNQSIRRDAAAVKAEEKAQAEQKALASMQRYGDDMIEVIDALIDENGNLRPNVAGVVGGVQGALPPGWYLDEDKQTALADLDRLQSMLNIEVLRDMKSQSRTGATGFGALSERELSVIESSASKIRTRRQGEDVYAKELVRVKKAIMDSRAAAAAAAGAGGQTDIEYVRDAQGRLVRKP